MRLPISLARTLNLKGAAKAGPLLANWARRSSRMMSSTRRQLKALHRYLSDPNSDKATRLSLGGNDVLEWVRSVLDGTQDEVVSSDRAENEIDVLGLPYYGPNGGKDSQGEYFDDTTDFLDGEIDTPPVFYTHGTQNGFDPIPIGKVKDRWYGPEGGWFRVQLDPQNHRYPELLDSFSKGNLFASSGVVPASYSVSSDGHIESWLVGELSLVDTSDGYVPVNRYAITKGTLKAFTFEDYYGEPVVGTEVEKRSVMDIVRQIFDILKGYLDSNTAEEIATEVAQEVAEEIVEGTDPMLGMVKAEEYGGVARGDLKDSDFALPSERKFPIMTQKDLDDAVSLWGRYKGPSSFETFKEGVKRIAARKDLTLPKEWQSMSDTKCATCEEAAKIKAEIEAIAAVPKGCPKCSEALNWVKAKVVEGKISPIRAFELLELFKYSDEQYETLKAQVDVVVGLPGLKAGEVLVSGGRGEPADPQQTIDTEWLKKQLKNSGVGEVKY